MSDTNSKTSEKSVIQSFEPQERMGVEIRTNTRLRQKYYVDKKDILTSIEKPSFKGTQRLSRIIRKADMAFLRKPVTLRCATKGMTGDIQVELMREGQRIAKIRISCPCGRHTELNCEYTQNLPKT